MTQEDIATAERKTLSVRAGSSRKLLARKALDKSTPAPASGALEDSFPLPETQKYERPQEPQSGSSSAPAAALAQPPAVPPNWSSEDEAGLQGLLARRRAAGYQRRGKDVAGQRLQPGVIRPNEGTVKAAQHTAAVAPLLAEFFHAGMGCQEVSRRLNCRGVPSPSGGVWHPEQVRRTKQRL